MKTAKKGRRIFPRAAAPLGDENEIAREEVPFVPAYDLLEEQETRLAPEEVCAIATALQQMFIRSDRSMKNSAWRNQARSEAVSQRLVKE